MEDFAAAAFPTTTNVWNVQGAPSKYAWEKQKSFASVCELFGLGKIFHYIADAMHIGGLSQYLYAKIMTPDTFKINLEKYTINWKFRYIRKEKRE